MCGMRVCLCIAPAAVLTARVLRCFCRGCQVALDVAEALHHMHTDLGVMHSDLKARWAACRRLPTRDVAALERRHLRLPWSWLGSAS